MKLQRTVSNPCRVIQNMLSRRQLYVVVNNERIRWRNQRNGLPGSKQHSIQAVELSQRSQTAVRIVSNLPSPSNGGPIYRFFGQAGYADPLDGWRWSSQKRVMSRLILVRQHQTNESGFVKSAIHKYMLGSRYPYGATGLNTGCTSDTQVSAKHNTQIPGPAIYTENPDLHLAQT